MESGGPPQRDQGPRYGIIGFIDGVADRWNRLVERDRDLIFLGSLIASSMVAFLPFARESAVSNFFVYALLLIVLVFANKKRMEAVPGPAGIGLVLALALIVGSFVFSWIVGQMTGNVEFGLTDFVILSAGVFLAFYSFENALVRFGVILLAIVRGGTLLLSMASASVFAAVSALLVGMVVFFSQLFISGDIRPGTIDGSIVIPGDGLDSGVFIGWACAGLEELIVITVMLYILIDSFQLSRGRTAVWLAAGIIGSFLINIVRMVILVWVAYTWDTERMLWVHTHLGDFLFLVWIGIFWVLFFKLGNPDRPRESQAEDAQAS